MAGQWLKTSKNWSDIPNNSVSETLTTRRACRSFLKRSVPEGLILDLVDKARRTPTAGNSQGVEFLILHKENEVKEFWDVSLKGKDKKKFGFPGLLKAPVLVIPLGVPSLYINRYKEEDKNNTDLGKGIKEWKVPYWLTDAAFSTMALQLLAIENGLASCFIGLFDREERIKENFSVPETREALGVLIMGYPDFENEVTGRSQKRKRRPLEDVVHLGKWTPR